MTMDTTVASCSSPPLLLCNGMSSAMSVSISRGQHFLPGPCRAVGDEPVPGLAQALDQRCRRRVGELARRFADVAPGRVNLGVAARRVSDLKPAAGYCLERLDQGEERGRPSRTKLEGAGRAARDSSGDTAHQIADVKIIALLGAVAVDDQRLVAKRTLDEGGDDTLLVRGMRAVNVGKA